MSATRLAYMLRADRLFNPADAAGEVEARYRYGYTNAFGWIVSEYAKLYKFAAEESYERQLCAERAQVADFEFLVGQAAMPFTGYVVYTLFDKNDALLYIGQSSNGWQRIGAHARKSWGHRIDTVRVIRCASSDEALALESRLIYEQDPPYNKVLRRMGRAA